MSRRPVHLVVALPAEARPLRRHFSLLPAAGKDCRLYGREDIRLLVCGVGSKAAGLAVTSMASASKRPEHALWINLGTAGHPSRALGEVLLVSGITDQASGRQWRTRPPQPPPCAVERLLTVQRPDPDYGWPGLHEMEAAGFYAAALDVATADAVQCIKVVSDNPSQPAQHLNGRLVSELISSQLGVLDTLIAQLRAANP